jgi:hypothetical protein
MLAHDTMNHAAAIARGERVEDAAVLFRIRAEFDEMPGLKLTLPQASRLFQLEAVRCEQVLGSLVDAGQLVLRGNTFLRTSAA